MSEGELESYKDGDIVWVKLGPCWWPGEVKDFDNVPKDIMGNYKKPPLAIVKFFDEDFYEDVKNVSHIVPYNCSKKMDFIKKGLDACRGKNMKMEKFPSHVCTAETRTDGNPNILDDPYFQPEKKTNYAALIFGSPKKSPKESPGLGRGRGRSSLGRPPKKSTPDLRITHRRFLGNDDHEVRILVQTPPEKSEQEEETNSYSCAMCGFQTSRIEVIVLHNKSHIQGVYTPVSTTKKGKRSPVKKTKRTVKMSHSKTSTIDEDLALLEKGLPLTVSSSEEEDDLEVAKPKKKSKQTSPKQKQKKIEKEETTHKEPAQQKEVKTDISKDLLADWEDDSDTEIELSTSQQETPPKNDPEPKPEADAKDTDKSCFDFDDDEDNEVICGSSNRKISRPVSQSDEKKLDLDDTVNSNIEEEKSKETQDSSNIEKEAKQEEDLNEAFNSILEETSVPKLPEVPIALKCEQNFHSDKTVKFPDKNEPVEKESATKTPKEEPSKLINLNPKKRFVKSFEDFELHQSEQRKIEQQKKESEKAEKNEEIVEEKIEKVKYIAEGELCDERSHCGTKPKVQAEDAIKVNTEKAAKARMEDTSKDLKESLVEHLHEDLSTEIIPDKEDTIEKTLQEEKEKEKEKTLENDNAESAQTKSETSENTQPKLEVSKLKTQLMSKLASPEKSSSKSPPTHRTRSGRKSFDRVSTPEPKHEEESTEKPKETKKRGRKRKSTLPKEENESAKEDHLSSPERSPIKSDSPEEKISFITRSGRRHLKMEEEKDEEIFESQPVIPKEEPSPQPHAKRGRPRKHHVSSEKKIEKSPEPTKTSKRGRRSHRHEEPHAEKNDELSEESLPKKTKIETDEPTNGENEKAAPVPKKERRSSKLKHKRKSLDESVIDEVGKEENEIKKTLPTDGKATTSESSDMEIESTMNNIIGVDKSTPKVDDAISVEEVHQTKSDVVEEEPQKMSDIVEEVPQTVSDIVEKVPQTSFDLGKSEQISSASVQQEVEIEPKTQETKNKPEPIHSSESEPKTVDLKSETDKTTPKESKIEILHDQEILSATSDIFNQDVKMADDKIDTKIAKSDTVLEEPTKTVSEDETANVVISDTKTQKIETSDDSETNADTVPNKNNAVCGNSEDVTVEHSVAINESDIKTISDCEKIKECETAITEDTNKKESPQNEGAKNKTVSLLQDNNADISSSLENKQFSMMGDNEMSALNTLATVSEMSTNLEMKNVDEVVPIENLTVVTEQDLADKQVEISTSVFNEADVSKPITLASFSLDFSDSNGSDLSVNEKVHESNKNANKTDQSNKQIKESDDDKNDLLNNKIQAEQKNQQVDVLKEEKQNVPEGELSKKEIVPKDSKATYVNVPSQETNASKEQNIESEMAKITNTNPELESVVRQPEQSSSSYKLLEILTDTKPKTTNTSVSNVTKSPGSQLKQKFEELRSLNEISITKRQIPTVDHGKNAKVSAARPSPVTKTPQTKSNKPIILSEKIIKPVTESDTVSVQKVTSKRTYQDVEDIDTFIIQKPTKKVAISSLEEENAKAQVVKPIKKTVVPKSAGKARILQQTIITPTGDIIQPAVSTQSDDNVFDINSMPIVLSDQILTPESIENMPIMLTDSLQQSDVNVAAEKPKIIRKVQPQVKLLNKTPPVAVRENTPSPKTYVAQKVLKTQQKVYQTQASSTKLKHSPTIITQPGKPGKFIIVPSTTPTGTKYTVGKKPPIKRSNLVVQTTQPAKTQSVATEPTGNKIMIVTNQQGQQSRVLLTPAQQKLLGYQTPTKTTRTATFKGTPVQKSVLTKGIAGAGSSRPNIISQTVITSKNQPLPAQNVTNQVMTAVTSQPQRNVKIEPKTAKRVQSQRTYVPSGLNIKGTPPAGAQKTIIIKNQHGQTLRKLQATDDALLDQQVQEQIQAIKASEKYLSGIRAQAAAKSVVKPPLKRVIRKTPIPSEIQKQIPINKTQQQVLSINTSSSMQHFPKTEAAVPPLAPITPPKKIEPTIQQKPEVVKAEETVAATEEKKDPQRPLNQLVIQDAMGNQTTITEGQILALPSETVDGQPQSYMLVTLDETGNLTPLNNEALMSLDQNLGLGGDLSNMVLQIDQGGANVQENSLVSEGTIKVEPEVTTASDTGGLLLQKTVPEQVEGGSSDAGVVSKVVTSEEVPQQVDTSSVSNVQNVTCSINNDSGGQQLLVTGDAIATQKFLESLTEGNPDLANILANAEGSSILIQTDGQQILINTEPDNNQVLLSLNSDNLNIIENSESDGNPIFATQPPKNQDILAAALADTDVFQQEQGGGLQNKVTQSQLSPNSTSLYPMNVGNVLETSLTLSSPIMTPLEVPSTNTKKIQDDETDILSQVPPKNVDLPITITDPNISQTVAHQHVASLISSELQNNLELPLAISEANISVSATEMNSPSYVYSLPTLDDSVDINQKTFASSISMPLLTEEPEENIQETSVSLEETVTTTTTSEIKKVEEKEQEEEVKNNEEVPVSVVEEEIITTTSDDTVETSTVVDVNTKLKSPRISEAETLDVASKLQVSKMTDETYLEEEGLCTLGGEMCSSLSEPPPDMFDVENPAYITSEIKEHSQFMLPKLKETTDIPEKKTQKQINHNEDSRQDALTEENRFESSYEESDVNLFNVGNSPSTNNTDENSCEIPVQPPIVTDLISSTFENFESNSINSDDSSKRCFSSVGEDDSNDPKKCKFD